MCIQGALSKSGQISISIFLYIVPSPEVVDVRERERDAFNKQSYFQNGRDVETKCGV